MTASPRAKVHFQEHRRAQAMGDMDPVRAAERGVAAVAPAPVEAWQPPSPKSAATGMDQVRKTPCWPRSWANFSLL